MLSCCTKNEIKDQAILQIFYDKELSNIINREENTVTLLEITESICSISEC